MRSYKLSGTFPTAPYILPCLLLVYWVRQLPPFLLIKHWIWLGVTAFLTFIYSAPKIGHPFFIQLRKIAIGKTIFLALAWAHITSLLPLLITTKDNRTAHIWYVANRFFFIYSICIVFDRRDVEKDREAGIKSLITFFSTKGIDVYFGLRIVNAFITSVITIEWFSLDRLCLLFLPLLWVCSMRHRRKAGSDYLYYFLLDGLMALSAPILILAKFAR